MVLHRSVKRKMERNDDNIQTHLCYMRMHIKNMRSVRAHVETTFERQTGEQQISNLITRSTSVCL